LNRRIIRLASLQAGELLIGSPNRNAVEFNRTNIASGGFDGTFVMNSLHDAFKKYGPSGLVVPLYGHQTVKTTPVVAFVASMVWVHPSGLAA